MTFLIWLGSGFAFAIGLLSGIALIPFVMQTRTKADETNEKSLQLLEGRNEIGRQQAQALWEIVVRLDRLVVRMDRLK